MSERFQQYYYLVKRKIELEHRQEFLNRWTSELEDESKRLENLSATEETKQKIAIIAASILRKNLPIAQAFEKEKKQLAEIKQNLQHCK